MRLINWLIRREPETNDENERAQKRHIDEVLARAEGRLNEQRRYTEQAIRDNPISHRIRARPAFNSGGRDVPEN